MFKPWDWDGPDPRPSDFRFMNYDAPHATLDKWWWSMAQTIHWVFLHQVTCLAWCLPRAKQIWTRQNYGLGRVQLSYWIILTMDWAPKEKIVISRTPLPAILTILQMNNIEEVSHHPSLWSSYWDYLWLLVHTWRDPRNNWYGPRIIKSFRYLSIFLIMTKLTSWYHIRWVGLVVKKSRGFIFCSSRLWFSLYKGW